MAEVDRDTEGSVWTAGGCLSWYVDATGRNSTLWPGSVRAYQRRLARFEIGDYDARAAAPPRGARAGARLRRTGEPMSKQSVQVDGRTAFVSGAASGIGRAVALRLAAHGCPVAIVDQDEDGLRETAELIAGPVLARTLDVRDRQAQMAFAAEVADWAPAPLGMVFNNAGVATSQSVAEGSVEDDEWVLDINLGGVVNGVRAFLPILLRQDSGVIVNTSSVFGLVGIPFQSAYCASKFAVRGFTESLRQELRGTGVQRRHRPSRRGQDQHRAQRPLPRPSDCAPTCRTRRRPGSSTRSPSPRPRGPPRSSTMASRPAAAASSSGPTPTCSTRLARLMPTRYFDVLGVPGWAGRRAATERLARRRSVRRR